MGINAVDGYGRITESNAKDIYLAWKKGKIDLSVAQQKRVESFLTPEEIEEVSYETKYEEGKDKINTDGTDNGQRGDQAGNATACTAGNIASVIGTTALAKVALAADGFTAFILGAAALLCAYASTKIVKAFDGEYDNRSKAKDEAENTNATLDGYSDSLTNTMDMMNEDMAIYDEQQNEFAMATNENTSQIALLQIELADAEAAGDVNAVKSLKEQIKQLENADMSGYEEGLEETSGRLEEYSAANQESMGVRDAGQSVSGFLKCGLALGITGYANTLILGLGAAAMAATAAGHIPKIAPLFPDTISSTGAKIFYGACALLLGISCSQMAQKSKTEIECSTKGKDMQDHVDKLTGMIGEQNAYIDETGASFEASGEEAQGLMDEGQEAADKLVKENTGDEPEDSDEPESTAPVAA